MTNVRALPVTKALDLHSLDLGQPIDDAAHADSRALVAYREDRLAPLPDITAHNTSYALAAPKHLPPPRGGDNVPDVRHLTPREMQEYSQDLYAAAVICFEDYEALAFQPDLHPDFNRTIGALTGEKAAPDRPRDFIQRWQERLSFTQRYYPSNATEVRQAHRILEALKAFPKLTDVFE